MFLLCSNPFEPIPQGVSMAVANEAVAFEFSLQAALSRVPHAEFRYLWQLTNGLERGVIAHAIREYLELERWAFKRNDATASEPDAYEQAIDEVVATCGGDVRGAVKALLVANEFLEAELKASQDATSAGYSRGKLARQKKR
jgi:hypothetical protein